VSDAREALAAALAGEHAAIYGYGVLGAHLTGGLLTQARQAEAAHRNRRDSLLESLSAAGATPPAAAPGYALPFPVTDRASAVRLATQIEERAAALWRAVLPPGSAADRRTALDALTDAAIRATRWRRAAGQRPGTVALPGAPP
jgi:Domain of unknown function (DUF4439)